MITKFILPTILVSTLALSGCQKKAPEPVGPKVSAAAPAAQPVPAAVVEQIVENFSRVQFEFDSAALDRGSRDALDKNAELLQAHSGVKVEIQGHADQRGTVDYNLALGQRRATAVREHLMLRGVGGARLTAISFGEERPLVAGHTETAWTQNRRAEFRILVADGRVTGTTD